MCSGGSHFRALWPIWMWFCLVDSCGSFFYESSSRTWPKFKFDQSDHRRSFGQLTKSSSCGASIFSQFWILSFSSCSINFHAIRGVFPFHIVHSLQIYNISPVICSLTALILYPTRMKCPSLVEKNSFKDHMYSLVCHGMLSLGKYRTATFLRQ